MAMDHVPTIYVWYRFLGQTTHGDCEIKTFIEQHNMGRHHRRWVCLDDLRM